MKVLSESVFVDVNAKASVSYCFLAWKDLVADDAEAEALILWGSWKVQPF